MKRSIASILFVAIICGILSAFSFGTAAQTEKEYDLDDPEQRLAYEMTFVTGTPLYERASNISDHYAKISLGTGSIKGTVYAEGTSAVTDIRIFMYIQKYESGKWKTIYDDTYLYEDRNSATMIRTFTDSKVIVKGYDYRVSYTIYAHKGAPYQSVSGASAVVR